MFETFLAILIPTFIVLSVYLLIKFRKKMAPHWREIVGWIVIVWFIYLYLFQINNFSWLIGREKSFNFLLVSTVLILGWLKLNKK